VTGANWLLWAAGPLMLLLAGGGGLLYLRRRQAARDGGAEALSAEERARLEEILNR
jgi:cytochrome c-type biogenesis protein CcmH